MRSRQLLDRMRQRAFRNIRFDDLARLLAELGFELARIRGSHHVFTHPAIPQPLSLQPVGGQVKPYQLRQVLRLLEEYNLLEDRT